MTVEPFLIEVSEAEIRREREKARELRRSRWWQTRVSRGVCHYCGGKFPADQLTLDHVVPIIRGGKSARGNCVPACKPCNDKKKYLLPIEWDSYLQSLGRADLDPEE